MPGGHEEAVYQQPDTNKGDHLYFEERIKAIWQDRVSVICMLLFDLDRKESALGIRDSGDMILATHRIVIEIASA